MSKAKESRIKLLDLQLEAANVEGPDKEGYYDVFVPGGVREFNRVTAKDEKEAVKKVRDNLLTKIEQQPESSDVVIQPDNVKETSKTEEKVNG